MSPTETEVDEAFQAGYASIDEGHDFYAGFGTLLSSLGYAFSESAPCSCSDKGAHGHLPECRWVRA